MRRALLFPANGMCGEFYEGLRMELKAQQVELTACTLPGFHGVPPLTEINWENMTRFALEIFDQNILGENDVLIGHSLGGLLAFLVALRRPGLRSLVLMEPAIVPIPWLARLCAKAYLRWNVDNPKFYNHSGGFRRIYDVSTFPPKMLDLAHCRHSDPNTVQALVRQAAELQPLPLGTLNTKTLLIRGSSSGVLMRWTAWHLQRKLPNAYQMQIPQAGHWMANEQDLELATAIASI